MRSGSAVLLLVALLAASSSAAQDELRVGTGRGLPGEAVSVQAFIRDVSGTPLGEDRGDGLGIQGFGFRVDFSPAGAIASSDFSQAGVTDGKSPVFPIITPGADHIVVILSFRESTDPLTFTLDAAAPGDVIGNLVLEIDPGAALDTQVSLTLAAATAELVNDDATVSESVGAGTLAVFPGTLLVQDPHIFSDGFEEGDTESWSATVGG